MSRRFSAELEVLTRSAPTGPEPGEFHWRGRRYVVAEVLARWTQSGSWWTGTAVRALHGGAAPKEAAGSLDDGEEQWWRVEAGSGRLAALSGGTGVYDLCCAGGRWSLKRVLD
jgi:hypothetical protein